MVVFYLGRSKSQGVWVGSPETAMWFELELRPRACVPGPEMARSKQDPCLVRTYIVSAVQNSVAS